MGAPTSFSWDLAAVAEPKLIELRSARGKLRVCCTFQVVECSFSLSLSLSLSVSVACAFSHLSRSPSLSYSSKGAWPECCLSNGFDVLDRFDAKSPGFSLVCCRGLATDNHTFVSA